MIRFAAIAFACFLSMPAWGDVDAADPTLAELVACGPEVSATFAGLMDAIASHGDRVSVSLAFGTVRGARAMSDITLRRDIETGDVVSLDAAVVVNWGATRAQRLGAIAHEFVHFLRLLNGSVFEGRGSDGERIADRTETLVINEALGSQ